MPGSTVKARGTNAGARGSEQPLLHDFGGHLSVAQSEHNLPLGRASQLPTVILLAPRGLRATPQLKTGLWCSCLFLY